MKRSWLRSLALLLLVPCMMNIIALGYVLDHLNHPLLSKQWVWISILFLLGFYYIYINTMVGKVKQSVSHRLSIMIKGRRLCYLAIYSMFMEMVLLILYGSLFYASSVVLFWTNLIVWLIATFFMLWNGMIRIFVTSKRLRLRLRVLMLLAMWIPVCNAIVLLYAMHKVKLEFEYDCYKQTVREMRKESEQCATRYPLLLVHGIGFRDLRYFNYWGRIPKELSRLGATIYYGHQEALGTIEYNAEQIKQKIFTIIEETGCEKVNIIAHSKGGLDARYAITCLQMSPYVASLTSLSTPHWGCRMVDLACRLPNGLYRFVAKCFDQTFHRFGDQQPDFYTATRQFSTKDSVRFNEEVLDMSCVYYQSYATKMKGAFSDPLLWIPYSLIKHLEGENDGLVSIESGKWGEFQGVVSNTKYRGISHGDIIDLKREDYQGFDVVEWFVKLVEQLKQKGF